MSKMPQEKMVHLVKEKVENKFPDKPPAQEGSKYYRELIFDTNNYQYIKKQCHKACDIYKRKSSSVTHILEDHSGFEEQPIHLGSSDEIDEETLFNEVLDRLTSNDYKALREFKEQSKITTYFTTIISHLVVDIQRKHKGRSRTKERAKAMGPIGEKLYELIFEKGFPVEEAYEYLKENDHIPETLEEIEAMVDKIRGRPTANKGPAEGSGQPDIKSAFVSADDPEKELIKKERKKLAKEVLNEIRLGSSSEERFIIERRFPLFSDEEEPKDLSEIARVLGTTTKAVDSRLRRILAKLKGKMLQRGLSIDDFIDDYA